MSAYTKGPWVAEGVHVRTPDQTLADVFLPNSDTPFRYRVEESFANARLMAAAPEMLEALNKIVEMNQQHALDQYGDAGKAESWACVATARAAIAKAEGK